jgi:hypothetical protein
MQREHRGHLVVLQRQARQLVYKVFRYVQREAGASMPVLDDANAEERTVEVCDMQSCKELPVTGVKQTTHFKLAWNSPSTPP